MRALPSLCRSSSALTTLRQIFADVALEAAHARFARVVADDVAQRALGDMQLVGLEPVEFLICFGSRYCLAIAIFSSSV